MVSPEFKDELVLINRDLECRQLYKQSVQDRTRQDIAGRRL